MSVVEIIYHKTIAMFKYQHGTFETWQTIITIADLAFFFLLFF